MTATVYFAATDVAPDAIIDITGQPAALTEFTEGGISGSLSVAAAVLPYGTPLYQWYFAAQPANTGGGPISGATGASFTIPKTLAVGAHYYYCVVSAAGAEPVASGVAAVNVAPVPEDPPALKRLKDAIAGAPADGTETAIELTEDVQLGGELTIGAGRNIKLWSKAPVTIKAAADTCLFTVRGALTLENHITLEGAGAVGGVYDSYYYGQGHGYGGGVFVDGGSFTINGGAITGCAVLSTVPTGHGVADGYGGGVYVTGGSFTMNGGLISGNTSGRSGGGVFVDGGSALVAGGRISGNTAVGDSGGIGVSAGNFTMTGGVISDNTLPDRGSGAVCNGAGVYLNVGSFTMTGGSITGNAAYGSAVWVFGEGAVSGGRINANSARGLAFTAYRDGTLWEGELKITGGEICGNTLGGVAATGGEVTVAGGTIGGNGGSGITATYSRLAMTDGEVCDNTSTFTTAGVSVFGGSFTLADGLHKRQRHHWQRRRGGY